MLRQTTAQLKVSNLRKRIRIVRGGTSASKTFTIIPMLITYAIDNPNKEISIVSESIPHLRRGAVRDFKKIMELCNIYNDNSFNKSTLTYSFPNGSFIEFFSADQPDKLRGARRDVLFVNECNNVSWESYYQMAIRTREFIYLDYNPVSIFWVDKELIGQPNTDFIVLTYRDNEALELSIVKEIESAREKAKTSEYWRNWWNVYGLGKVGSLSGVCIPEWKEIKLPEEARLLCAGMDFGYSNDPTTLVYLYKYNDAYIFDEIIYQKKLLNSDISNLLKSHDVNCVIYCDSAEPKSIAELRYLGHNTLPCTKGKDSIVYGLNLINQNKIYITNRSTNLIKELQSYIWMKDREGNTINKPIDAFNHCIDAARYSITSQLQMPNRGKYFIR